MHFIKQGYIVLKPCSLCGLTFKVVFSLQSAVHNIDIQTTEKEGLLSLRALLCSISLIPSRVAIYYVPAGLLRLISRQDVLCAS